VIICHGFKGFKDWGFFPHLAARIANAGFTAISFNFSGSGVGPDNETFSELKRFGHATYAGDLRDIEIVFGALLDGQVHAAVSIPTRVGLFGHSRGGGAAALFASNHDVHALVTWNAISTIDRWPREVMERWDRDGVMDVLNARTGQVLPLYRDALEEIRRRSTTDLDILAACGRISAPWLIVHGSHDEAVGVDNAEALGAAAAGQASLEIIEGGTHTFGARHPWAGETEHLKRAMELTLSWFSRHLP